MAKKLYPELLDYSAIQEYKSPIFSMLAQLTSKGLIKPKSYKKFRKQMLNDAKIQLKRQLGLSNYSVTNRNAHRNYHNQSNGILEDYVVILYPFIKEKDMKQFFQRLLLVKDKKIRTTYISLLAKDDFSIPEGMLNSLASDINSRNLLFNKLEHIEKLNLFPKAYRNEKSLAEAIVFEIKQFNKQQDSILFLEQKPLTYRGKKYTGYYFKTRNNLDYDTNFEMHLIVFEKGKGLTTKPFYKNKGLRIEDIDTDEDVLNYVTEAFLLKDRKRATVHRPNGYGGYGFNR